MSNNGPDRDFEATLKRFDDTVATLESDTLSLEEAVAQYEAAVALAAECAEILKNAELRIVEIDKSIDELDSDAE